MTFFFAKLQTNFDFTKLFFLKSVKFDFNYPLARVYNSCRV